MLVRCSGGNIWICSSVRLSTCRNRAAYIHMEREGGAYRNTLVTQGSLHTHGEGGRGVQKYISNTGQPTYTWRGREGRTEIH